MCNIGQPLAGTPVVGTLEQAHNLELGFGLWVFFCRSYCSPNSPYPPRSAVMRIQSFFSITGEYVEIKEKVSTVRRAYESIYEWRIRKILGTGPQDFVAVESTLSAGRINDDVGSHSYRQPKSCLQKVRSKRTLY